MFLWVNAISSILYDVGDDVVLKCSSIGIPAPVMSWYRDDIPLAQQKDDDITAGMMGETVTRLTLPCVTAGATYKCKAKAGRQEVGRS